MRLRCRLTSSPCSPNGSAGSSASATCATRCASATSCASSTTATRRRSPNGQVDDTPYGGGAGMVIRVDVVDAALQAVYGPDTGAMLAARRVVVLTPAGRPLDDGVADELAAVERLTLLCGRYEGIDERVREHLSNDAISVGPYVLSGGELAAMVVSDSVLRKLPGALGDEHSAGGGVVQHGARGRGRVPALHASGELPRMGGAGRAAVRAPRAGSSLAFRSSESGRPSLRSCSLEPPHRGGSFTRRDRDDRQRRAPQVRPIPDFRVGDRVRVHFQVVEGTRRRTQVFEGIVLKQKGGGSRRTFTVRKLSFGVGVERTFPAALAQDRAHRGHGPRRGPPRQALLPARPGRACRPPARDARLPPRRGRRDRRSERGGCGGRRRRGGGRCGEAEPQPTEAAEPSEASPTDGGRSRGAGGRGAGRERGGRGGAEAAEPAAEAASRRGARGRGRSPPTRASSSPLEQRQPASVIRRIRENSLVELIVIVALAIGLALGIQAVLVKPYRIPERVDGAHARRRPARAGQPRQLPHQRPRPRRCGRVPPARGRRGQHLRRGAHREPALLQAKRRQGQRELHQADRRHPGRHDLGARRARGRQRQAPGRAGTSARVHPEPAISRKPSRFRRVTFL